MPRPVTPRAIPSITGSPPPKQAAPPHLTVPAGSAGQNLGQASPTTFAEVIALWPSATDLAAILDVEAVTVRAWRRRGIPARYWSAVALAARVSSRPVDERLLAELGSLRRFRHG